MNTDDINNLKFLDEQNTMIKENLSRNRTELRIAFRKAHPSLLYRLMHNTDERVSYIVPFYAVFIIGALLAVLILGNGLFANVGDSRYILSPTENYECPNCDWEGNCSEMFTYSDGWVYYYCPECGHVIGRIMITDDQAPLVNP